MSKLKVLIVGTAILCEDKPEVPYAISCLEIAFNEGSNDGKIDHLIYDLTHRSKKDFPQIAKELVEKIIESKCNIVAFSTFVFNDKLFIETMSLLSKIENHPIILVGGKMVCGNIENLKQRYPYDDFFIESNGEKVFSNLGYYLSAGKQIIKDEPDYESLKSPYLSGIISLKEGMTVSMELRRGCPFRCTFCCHGNVNCDCKNVVHIIGNEERWRKELLLFKENKISKINVTDPCFNDKKTIDTSLYFLKLVKELQIDAKISLQIRPEMLTPEFLNLVETMKNLIFEVGIQSLDEKVLPLINRGNREKVIEQLKEIQKRQITTEITLIYGLPKQTAESFKNDIELLKDLGFEKITAFPLQLYPGTKLYDTYQEYGLEVRENDLGIMEVYNNSSHDFDKMQEITNSLSQY